MKKVCGKSLFAWPVITVTCLVGAGCVNLEPPGGPAPDPTLTMVASMRADSQMMNENQRKLVAAIEELQQTNARQAKEIQQLNDRLATVEARVGKAEASWREGIERNTAAIRQESEARQKSLDQVVNVVSEEVGKVSKQQARSQAQASGQRAYTVQRGDTLNQIAKAFGVSVDSLRDANGLRDDRIIEGQALKIPER
ncbi:MAG: hypothetical protein A3K19_17805 [Lentisphaerae bacterium RIFOXYB12_FULL_65_16]|nr:MAG: hypothetical protein A3K18_15040 [Lentisphaerae bacterium RIFOXYA12_64_32]OGV85304.1 MAG: hypothetical protein A3K19_17805 [Lentisphaerae bacterium RIFOXYB12_FULL_65_16]